MSYIKLQDLVGDVRKKFESHGYWVVDGDKAFYSKNLALMYCTQHNTRDIGFRVDDTTFDFTDWSHDPEPSLAEIYRRRAQQLRDKYDYVALTWSGGSDSLNVLHSFIENGIMPDEVISYVFEGQGFEWTNNNNNVEIYKNREILDEYLQGKNVKFTTINVAGLYESSMFDDPEWILYPGGNRPCSVVRFLGHYLDKYRRMREQGKSVCVVYGFEKPRITLKDGKFYSFFLDHTMQWGTHSNMYDIGYDGPTYERFYISGDMPEVTIKQCHVIIDHFLTHYPLDQIERMIKNDRTFSHENYRNIINKVLYQYRINENRIYHIGKKSNIFSVKDDWLWTLPKDDARVVKSMQGYRYLKQVIGQQFFDSNDPGAETIGCISPMYYLGDAPREILVDQ